MQRLVLSRLSRALYSGCFETGAAGSRNGRAARSSSGSCVRHTRSPGADAAAIHCVIGEAELQRAIQLRRHMVDTAAFFVFLRAAPIGRIEHDAIARFQRSNFVRRRRLHGHACIMNSGDRADMHTAMARAAAVHNASDGSRR